MIPLDILNLSTAKKNQFLNKNIECLEDIVEYIPKKYYDFRKNKSLNDIKDNDYSLVYGKVIKIFEKSKGTVSIYLKESISNKIIFITFFKSPFILKMISYNEDWGFCGKIGVTKDEKYGFTYTMINPIEYSKDLDSLKKIKPIYSKIKGMSDSYLMNVIEKALSIIDKEELFDMRLLNENDLISYSKALRFIHFPNSFEDIEKAKYRFLFENLFKYNYHLISEIEQNKESPFKMTKYNKSVEFMNNLPFELTEGQRLALRKMSLIMQKGRRLNALVLGDVGCGKTMVAMLLSVVSANNGYQTVVMCPTLVLAKQHYREFCERIEPLGYKIGFISGDIKKREKDKLLKELKEGTIHILVGTHSAISDDIQFKNLAMALVDEEHRFGVRQKEGLSKKASLGVHKVNMSATPIPRSLAISAYGDNVETITIKTLPKGRKPVKTNLIKEEEESYPLILHELKKGRQCYVVCPLIEESSTLDNVESVEQTKEKFDKYFIPKGFKVGVISGKMKQGEINKELDKFLSREYDIIISTTIIEVGVNVPNSTIILIKNAERFGLSQLHQLRGRVGRGSYQSYCILQSNNMTELARRKLKAMVSTNDGFEISKKDLEIRGAGNIVGAGTSQSGNNKYFTQLLENPELNTKIREIIKEIINNEKRNRRYKKILLNDMED